MDQIIKCSGEAPIFKISKNLNLKMHSTRSITTDVKIVFNLLFSLYYIKVAIKQAVIHATEDDLEGIQKEVEIMKILEYHSNVVWYASLIYAYFESII